MKLSTSNIQETGIGLHTLQFGGGSTVTERCGYKGKIVGTALIEHGYSGRPQAGRLPAFGGAKGDQGLFNSKTGHGRDARATTGVERR